MREKGGSRTKLCVEKVQRSRISLLTSVATLRRMKKRLAAFDGDSPSSKVAG